MTSTDPFDSPALKALYKEITNAWNEGMEQTKRAMDCRIRRFYFSCNDKAEVTHDGVVFPDGTVVVKSRMTGSIGIVNDLNDYTGALRVDRIQWIDPEKLQ